MYDVHERVGRQLRSIGDALAWRVFGYDRRIIVALSRNDSVGDMFGKAGLVAEREIVDSAWRERRQFALLHDLTSALRIGDVSVFHEKSFEVVEVKTNPAQQKSAQQRRILQSVRALTNGEPVPRDGQILIPIDLPYRTHLDGLREILALAMKRGMQGGVPGGRAVVAGAFSRHPIIGLVRNSTTLSTRRCVDITVRSV